MIRKQVLFTPSLHAQVERLTAQQGSSFSAVVRQLIQTSLEKNTKRKMTGLESLQWLADNAFEGGPKDLAENDDYLYKI